MMGRYSYFIHFLNAKHSSEAFLKFLTVPYTQEKCLLWIHIWCHCYNWLSKKDFNNEISIMCVHGPGESCHLGCGQNTSLAAMWKLRMKILPSTFKIWLVMSILPASCNMQTIFSSTHYIFRRLQKVKHCVTIIPRARPVKNKHIWNWHGRPWHALAHLYD